MQKKVDRLCGLAVRVPGYRKEMYCVSCELRTEYIYIYYVKESRPPLWSSDQSSWLQIQRCGFDFWRYQIFRELVGLERGPLSLVSTIKELLERKNSGSGIENRECGRRDPSRWSRDTLYQQMLALTSPTSGCGSVGIIRSRTRVTVFFYTLSIKVIHSVYCSIILSSKIKIKRSVFLDITPRSPMIVNGRFGGVLHVHLQWRK
jgi:hypothetical protein